MTLKTLINKHNGLVREMLTTRVDSYGFVETTHCDSTFLSGLIGSNPTIPVNLTAACSTTPGKWYRRPTVYTECYFCKESRSTISRDTLLGVFWWAYANNRKDVLEDIWNYAWKHFWIMGEGRYYGADTIMNPIMMSTLAQLLGKKWFSWISSSWTIKTEPKDFYVNRLIALHIGLRREIYKKQSSSDKKAAAELHRMFPQNPLFAWAAGKHAKAEELLIQSQPGGMTPRGVHNQSEYIYEWLFVAGRLI